MNSDSPHSETDDLTLLRRFSNDGDRASMELIFQRNAGGAYRIAMGCLRNSADAEEAVQAAFIELLNQAGRVAKDSNANVRGWIMSVVIATCRKKLRDEAQRRKRELAAVTSRAHAATRPDETTELAAAAVRSVEALPERYRLPVWLHYLEGFTFKEVAAALSIPENTAAQQAHRGITQVREALAAAGFTAGALLIPELLSAADLQGAPPLLASNFSRIVAWAAAKNGGSGLPGPAAAKSAASIGAGIVVKAVIILLLLAGIAFVASKRWAVTSNPAANIGRVQDGSPAGNTAAASAPNAGAPGKTTTEKPPAQLKDGSANLLRQIDCSYINLPVSTVFTSLCDALEIRGRMTQIAQAQAAQTIVSLDLGKVTGAGALDELARKSALKLAIRDGDVILEAEHEPPAPPRAPADQF